MVMVSEGGADMAGRDDKGERFMVRWPVKGRGLWSVA